VFIVDDEYAGFIKHGWPTPTQYILHHATGMKQLFNLAGWQTFVLPLKKAFCLLPKQALQQKWIQSSANTKSQKKTSIFLI
jgi:hypothetical protein